MEAKDVKSKLRNFAKADCIRISAIGGIGDDEGHLVG